MEVVCDLWNAIVSDLERLKTTQYRVQFWHRLFPISGMGEDTAFRA